MNIYWKKLLFFREKWSSTTKNGILVKWWIMNMNLILLFEKEKLDRKVLSASSFDEMNASKFFCPKIDCNATNIWYLWIYLYARGIITMLEWFYIRLKIYAGILLIIHKYVPLFKMNLSSFFIYTRTQMNLSYNWKKWILIM